ncbi:MAG TPA: GNAT family N-acetyltransferase [Bacteroidia bacterium]|nr:GNAT family N-acetyltransferase [Bacteroidia bacterium]
MKIYGYGIELVRVRHEDIELVRKKRNSLLVRQYMEFREEITPEMQEKWFLSINNRRNNYFIICMNGEKIGLVYGAEIDWEKKETGNGGIFIWDEKWLESSVSLMASFVLIEITFLLGLERTYVKILRTNERAIRFNHDLGYELLPGQENIQNQHYVLNGNIFFSRTEKVRKALVAQFGSTFEVVMDTPGDDSEQHMFSLYEALPAENRKRLIVRRL